MSVSNALYADAGCDQGLTCPPYENRRILATLHSVHQVIVAKYNNLMPYSKTKLIIEIIQTGRTAFIESVDSINRDGPDMPYSYVTIIATLQTQSK